MLKNLSFRWKLFQIEDIARAALVDGVIFSWEPGLGKTLAALAWATIKRSRRVLLVVPGHLHRQFVDTAFIFFNRHLIPLSHRRQLRHFKLHLPLPDEAAQPRFFITTYHELGYNNTRHGEPSLAECLQDLIAAGAGVDAVIVDEGTRLQGDTTHIATGVRRLEPRLRMILTGTPVKNRLESFFWLASWAGREHWPYPATTKGRDAFERDFLTSIRRAGSTERSARITNIHELWRITSPFIIRRRKVECGEEIVPKIVKPLVLKPSTFQKQVYQIHLCHPPLTSAGGKPVKGFGQVAMQLGYLRQAALCPHSDSLEKVHSAADGLKRSPSDFNSKMAACLSLIDDLLRKGEQVIIGSTFHAFSHSLHARLLEAKVSSLLLDGGTNPHERGQLAELFKRKLYSVLVAGIAAMSEGLDFDNCSHLILPSLSWAYDENEQFVNRIWRITSRKAVHVYPLTVEGTIDERMQELYDEKSNSAQLALDFRLLGADVQDLDLGQLLKRSVKQFDAAAGTIDELAIEQQWHQRLRDRLTNAEIRFRLRHPVTERLLDAA